MTFQGTVEVKKHRHLLLESLKFEKIDSRHDNIKKAHAKTCQWLMQHPDYADWQDVQKFGEHHGILWISGKPGAGKSTIMKFAVSQASQHGQGTVISFFFNARGEDLEKTVLGLYRSLLYQLLKNIPDLQSVLDDQSAPPLGKDMTCSWSPHKLKSLLLKVIEQLGTHRVTCFIDALDECAEKEVREMLSFFEELGECAASSKTLLYACFSSRHYPHVHIDHGLKLTLEAQAGHAKDLEDYVRTKLKNEDGESPQTMEIVEEIIRKASGVFMWVVLVIDILNREFQKGRMFAVRQRLATIPERLSDLFRDMLVRDNENMDDFRLCIQWVLYSRRPLKRREYYFAMVSGLYPERLEHQCAEKISEEAMDRFVIDSSKGLAETTATPETTDMEPTVQFIHESVRDFLLKDNGIQVIWPEAAPDFEATSNEKLKSCCSSFIKITDLGLLSLFDRVPKPLSKALKLGKAPLLRRELTKGYPFAEYAIRNLFHHADHAAGSTPQIDFMTDFSSTDRADWIVIYNVLQKYEKRRLHETVSLLCILAIHNSACLIRQYLHHDLQERWPRSWPTMENYCTPLHAAIFEDSEDAAVALLSRNGKYLHKVLPGLANEGVDVDHSDSKGRTALLLAAEKGQDRVVKKDPRNLEVAVAKNFVSASRLLLKSGAHVSGDSLRFAVRKSRREMVEILLDGDTDVNSSDERGYTALHLAAELNLEAIAQILLEKGANVQKQDESGRSPLCVASAKGNLSLADVLILGGADVNRADSGGHNALWRAVWSGHVMMAKLLLVNGADIHCAYAGGQTLLHIATQRRKHSVAGMLLAHGARVNQGDQNGRTPLHYAQYSVMFMKKLINNGADVNSRDDTG
ncbi:ankyrin, partial [Colletotrichum zoysiae]